MYVCIKRHFNPTVKLLNKTHTQYICYYCTVTIMTDIKSIRRLLHRESRVARAQPNILELQDCHADWWIFSSTVILWKHENMTIILKQTFQPICSKNEHKRACPVVFPPHGPETPILLATAQQWRTVFCVVCTPSQGTVIMSPLRRHIFVCFMAKSAFWRCFSALAPYTGVGPK